MTEPDPLAQPLPLPCGATLRNRIVKTALSEGLADAHTGAPTDRLVRLYERWGQSGAGMLLTGNVLIDRDAREGLRNVVIEDDRHLPALRRWADAAQAHGAALWMQLNHAGRQSSKRITREPLSASNVPLSGVRGFFFDPPRPMREAEIEAVIGRFARAASVARAAGFAGVQIHAAHGYLLSQFLSPLTNHRDDAWGGDAERRSRLLLAVYDAVRSSVGADFPVGLKLNSADFQRGGFDEGDSMRIVAQLAERGADLIEVSGGNYENPAMVASGEVARPSRETTVQREAYFQDYARRVRKHCSAPILLTGGLRSAAAMRQVVADSEADAVGLGRPMVLEPELPRRLLNGSAKRARAVPVRVGIRLFDDVIQLSWFQSQLRRMGAGRSPEPRASRWAAVLRGLVDGYLFNPFARRRPRLALNPMNPPRLGGHRPR